MSKKRNNSKKPVNSGAKSKFKSGSGTHVERPPLSNDGPEWDDYAYTASDF